MELYDLKLSDYIEIISRRKMIILLVFSVIFFSFFAYTNLQVPMYKAVLIFKVTKLQTLLPSEFLFPGRARRIPAPEELSDYVRSVVGRTVLESALEELGWLGDASTPGERASIISNVQSGISASEIRKTNMIKLEVVGKNPHRAAELANKIFEVFKRANIEEKNKQRHDVTVFIRKQLDDVSEKLQQEEKRLGVLITHGVVGMADGMLTQIDDLEKERASLLTLYTERYPEVMGLTEQINELKAELKALPKEEFEYSVLKRDIAVDQQLYNSLKQKLQESQIQEAERIDNIVLIDNASPPKNPFYPKKMQNYLLGTLLGVIFGAASAIFMEQVMETSIGRIEDIEALIKVSIVGVIPYFSGRIKGEETSKRKRRKFIFKPHREESNIRLKSQLIARHSEGSIFMEAFRILGTNVQVIFGEGARIKNKIIMITSSNPGEGKSIITSNLAVVLAQMGYKTLLIDTDLRRASIHRVFGLRERTSGFTDVLLGKYKFEELETSVIKTATDLMLGDVGAESVLDKPWLNNLHILTSGSVFPNPIHLFNSEKLKEVLEYLKNNYDVVLIDSSPILAVSDPSILLPRIDGVLLVYRVGATSRLTLRRAKTHVESIRGKGSVNGLILNNVVRELSMDSYYYYHRKYYTREEKEEKKEDEDKGHT